MRFGITPINIEAITSVFDKGSGITSFMDFKFSDIVQDAAERGYKHIEITMDIFQILPIQVNDAEIQRLKTIKKDYDLTYSAHFPIWSIDLSSPNKFIREGSAQALIHAYNQFKGLEEDIEVYVLHPSGALAAELTRLDIEIEDKYRKIVIGLFVGFATTAINQIFRNTKIDRNKVAIENIEFPFEGTLDIIKKLTKKKDDRPRLLIDTAHFLGGYSGKEYMTAEGLIDITEKHLDITSEIHLQAYSDGGAGDHEALGKGRPFPVGFLKLIHDYGFKGPIVFELPFEKAKVSIEFIKKNMLQIPVPEIK